MGRIRRQPTFADVVREADREIEARRPAPVPPEPPRVPRSEEEHYVAPDGRLYLDANRILRCREAREIGLAGAWLVIDPVSGCEWPPRDDPDDVLVWVPPADVLRAATRGEPILRSDSLVALHESEDGRLLLSVLGDGLLWPPLPDLRRRA